MTRTLTQNVNAFDKQFYQAISKTAGQFARDSNSGALIGRIPKATPENSNILNDATQYKKPLFEESVGVTGGVPSLDQEMMTTSKDHAVYDIVNVNAYLHWDKEDLVQEGPYFSQMQREQLAEWARQSNMSIMKGVHKGGFNEDGTGQNSRLNWGILDQATMVLNLDKTNSALTTAGDVYNALSNFCNAIPYQYRAGKKIILGATPGFYDHANAAAFTYNNGETEWEQFFRIHVKGQSPLKVDEDIIWSDDLFADLGANVGDAANVATHYDCADGSRNNAYTPETDVLATTDRLFAAIMEPDIVERAYSRGFSLRGEAKNYVGGITQSWTIKEAGCVHRPLAVLFSEQITWV